MALRAATAVAPLVTQLVDLFNTSVNPPKATASLLSATMGSNRAT